MTKKPILGMACDHGGANLKNHHKEWLTKQGYTIIDFGTDDPNTSVDYALYAHRLAKAIENGEVEKGIAICGSGNGISMTLNKHRSIRAALCWNPEIAALATRHNNANVCSMPGRFISFEEGEAITTAYLNNSFEGGRHQRRIDLMGDLNATC